jgi:hypothetical protein
MVIMILLMTLAVHSKDDNNNNIEYNDACAG